MQLDRPLVVRRALVLTLLAIFGSARSVHAEHEPVWDLMVVGAGPGGTFAALEVDRRARAAGLAPPRTLVLEQRAATGTRARSVGMGRVALNATANVGVDWSQTDLNHMKGITDEELVEGQWKPIMSQRFRRSRITPQAPRGLVRDVIGNQGFAKTTVAIRDAESALRKPAEQRANIEVRYQTRLGPDDSVSKAGALWKVTIGGQVHWARFLAAADGAHSAEHGLAAKLGVKNAVTPEYEGLRTSWVVGQLAKNANSNGFLRQRRIPDAATGGKRKIAIMPGRATADGFDVEVPDGHQLPPDELEPYWRDHLQYFDLPRDSPALEPPRQIQVELRRADRVVVEGSAFIIGDAARAIHPGKAAGMQTAWVVDGANLADVYVASHRSSTELARALARFEQRSRQATEVLQAQSVSFFADSPRKRVALEHADRLLKRQERPKTRQQGGGMFSRVRAARGH
jgi:2-polyprenyl-6-methoxyphenol hydroxylase-like FAD-dependent oxidoreductase